MARVEGLRLGHDFIGTEHVLLGVMRSANGALARVLQNAHIDQEAVRKEIERLVFPQSAQAANAALPFTPRARKALEFARHEAKALKQPLISADHIVVGLLLEGRGVGARPLKNLGLQAEQIRSEIFRTCGPE
jgi:ATP-dependent Clp protease ATP-binding subunit ClpC